MSDITVEKKLQLIQQVRSQQNRNQYDLMNREQILYGKTTASRFHPEDLPAASKVPEGTEQKISTFKIRIGAAILLFAAMLVLDLSGKGVFGITSNEIFQYIARDFEMNGTDVATVLSDAVNGLSSE